jgi:hypothetical protein
MTRIPKALVLTALAAAMSSAFAQEAPGDLQGYVGIGGIYTHPTSGTNQFKLREYRDLDSGATGAVDLRLEGGDWWSRLFGENLAREDQFIELKGGKYGVFKFAVYNDKIIHNWTYGAITPFSGVGTNQLTYAGNSPPSTNTATWNQFDYGVTHDNFGGFAETSLTPGSPFYFRVNANRKESNGIKPLGAAGTSPGGPAYELPAPIDWRTTDVGGEIGYSTKRMHLSLSYTYSKFDDANEFLFWRTPAVQTGPNMEMSTIAPDNKMQRWVGNAVFKQMPMDSTLALRGTYARYESGFAIAPTFLSVTGSQPAGVGNTRNAGSSASSFDGEVVNTTFSAAYNSNWSRAWSSKIYYNYYKRENDSTEVVFTPSGPGSGGTCDVNPVTNASLTTCSTEFLHLDRNNLGAEVYYRINRANKLTLGVDYNKVERERVDFDRTQDFKLTAEWKSGMWEMADFRVKYIHLDRDADFQLGTNTSPFVRDLYRFDVAPLKRDTLKVAFDMSPMPLLDLGLELNLKRSRYEQTTLGRTDDRREEVSLSASYGDAASLRMTSFFDWEHTRYDSNHWVGDVATYPTPNPGAGAYFWNSQVNDRNWLAGFAADWFVNDKLKVYASLIWQKGDGGVDFTAPSVANAQNITNYDDFQKRALNIKATWRADKNLEFTFGAAYEKYTYSDIQMNDYIYNLKTGSNQNYFSGAYANPSYRVNIIYGMVAYRF